MTMLLIIQTLVAGIILGALYGLIGCSLTIIYGTMRVVNFAHGDFVVAGCYAALVLLGFTGLNPLIGIPIVFIGFFGLGMALYTLIMPRLRRADDPELASFLSFYGVSLMAGAAMLYLFDADTRALNYSFHPAVLHIAGLLLPTARIVALIAGLVLIALLSWFLYRTLPGKALRAAIMNPGAIGIIGVDINRLSALAFGLAIGLAGVTGVLIALVFPAFGPFSGVDFTLIGFVVIVLGGLGHPVGAILGGVLYGLAEQLAILFLPQSLAPLVGFAILIATVMLRPAGLFGRVALR